MTQDSWIHKKIIAIERRAYESYNMKEFSPQFKQLNSGETTTDCELPIYHLLIAIMILFCQIHLHV